MQQWRNLMCGAMIVLLPASLLGQNPSEQASSAQVSDDKAWTGASGAMLHANGGVWLNGSPAPKSSAIFPNDVVQTQKNSSATIDVSGSAVTIGPETIVQFAGADELDLDHGSLELNTAREMRVRVNCLTVTPIAAAWTHYSVVDVDGKVRIAAITNDVRTNRRGGTARQAKQSESPSGIVHQGEEATRDEHCGAAAKPADMVDAKGALLDSWWAKGTAIGAIGLTCLLICTGDDPISPSTPR